MIKSHAVCQHVRAWCKSDKVGALILSAFPGLQVEVVRPIIQVLEASLWQDLWY